MAINNFKPFATAANANVTAQADWETLPALLSGFMAGKASSAQVNKAIRQASFIAAALAQYTTNKSGLDVLDDGDLNGFIAKMSAAFGKDFQALDATLTALAGLKTGANKLPYFTGTDTASQTDLTSVGRDIIGKSTIADILTYLHLIGGLASDVVGRLIGVRVYTASTAYVETEGTKTGLAIITGGGGGGGSCHASSTANTFSGAGGGAAGTCIGLFNLSDITNKAITIGAGGIGQTDGGNTTFAGMVAGGGGKGNWATSTSTPGGSGGTATGGILNIPGGMGNDGQAGAYLINGNGGGSLWGSGGRSGQGGGIGAPAYGAGGGGAYDTAFTNTTYQGGNGAPGVALILEFA